MFTPLVLATVLGFTAAPPVRVVSCSILTPTVIPTGADAGTMTVGGYGLQVRFMDMQVMPVSRVTFRLSDGSSVVDAGIFSSDVLIDHVLSLPQTQADTCSVASVTLANGETWTAIPRR